MFKKREVPVYLFTGFLESGKTSFIIETMREHQFEDGLSTLFIVCEEGMEEVEPELLLENKFKVYTIDEETEINKAHFQKLEREERPDRVLIEYNGMWNADTLMESMPDQWVLAEAIAVADATTYLSYLNNMKALMLAQFAYADLICFNRCREDQDLAMFKRTAHAKNRRAQILFEMEDGTLRNDIKEELPYDLNAPVIEIEDDDYGLWYLDAFDEPQKYVGKTIRFKGQVAKPRRGGRPDIFMPGRLAMTCCAADIQFVGFPCRFEGTGKLKEKSFVTVTATVQTVKNQQYDKDMPFLIAKSVEKAEPPEDEVVYFT